MANQYTDIKVIECSRLHSEEAKSKNNENFALWTSNLTDIATLTPGDKVSVFGAMVSERGAGQSSSIEIKGVNLGYKKTYTTTNVNYQNASTHLPSDYEIISSNASDTEVYMRDDTLNFTTQYYQTANAHNYIHLPRNYWYKSGKTRDLQWTESDTEDAGMSTYFKKVESDPFSFKSEYFALDDGTNRHYKPLNDNGKYTIMMRDNTYYTESSASGQLGGFFNSSNAGVDYNDKLGRNRDPENASYSVFKELKSITLPAGFNSPEYIASEVTRQLQNITQEKIHKYSYNGSMPAGELETPVSFYRTITTETYKPFNVANQFRSVHTGSTKTFDFGVIKDAFDEYFNLSGAASTNGSGYDYLSQYHIIGCKRPELYQTGLDINRKYFDVDNPDFYEGIRGAELKFQWLNNTNRFSLNLFYNETNVNRLKAFFDAQLLYPEIWDYFKESTNDYSDADTINNSRWIHMNRFKNASMTYSNVNSEAALGDSYYSDRTFNQNNRVHSALLPIYYENDPSLNQFFPRVQLEASPKFSYGIIGHDSLGYITLRGTENNGVNTDLWTELLNASGDTKIEDGRKCGFDLHFNAPGMNYILPYAGYSPVLSSYQVTKDVGDYGIHPLGDQVTTTYLDGSKYVNKLYLGADNPALSYDGTNFYFSGLHTPLNIPNDNRVSNPQLTDPPSTSTDAGAVMYTINPKEYLNDWTPERKPYIVDDPTISSTAIPNLNKNLQPWVVYDSHCGIFIGDFKLSEEEWIGSLWDLLGFTYDQFNSTRNTRLNKIDTNNRNDLSLITTNAEIDRGDSKIYVQNSFGIPLYSNMMPIVSHIYKSGATQFLLDYYPPIQQKTESLKIVAEKLPTRMIRGYYTIRSNILQEAPFIGGKVNNTTMPIIGIVDKINGDGDFYFGQESSLQFTVTKPLRLASITCSIHDPDGSYAHCSEQSTVLFKIEKSRSVTFNVVEEILQEQQQQK